MSVRRTDRIISNTPRNSFKKDRKLKVWKEKISWSKQRIIKFVNQRDIKKPAV